MIQKLILCLLLALTVFGQNCLPGQYVDLQKGKCGQCADLPNTVQGGKDGLCECQSGYWFSVEETKCLTQEEIKKLYTEKSDEEAEQNYRDAHAQANIRGRNLGVIYDFSSTRPDTVMLHPAPKPVVQNTTVNKPVTVNVKPASTAERPKPMILPNIISPAQNLRKTN